ncbi:MAG: DNA methyltransferase [Thermodesulfobacteriota bacterium]|nr:MAG: DNA methyltransferase [Thermodesulfobacteriota bacterium]
MNQNKKSLIPDKALIETEPPVVFASRLALREGNRKKPIYQMHKWWARRLGSVFRSLLLSAITSENESHFFKKDYFYHRHNFSGLRVLDPFVGGGTSLIEAAKCNASVIGIDIDPVACFVTAKELGIYNEEALLAAFSLVEKKVKEEIMQWYHTELSDGRKGLIMYAFWVDQIKCPSCCDIFEGHPHFQLRRYQKKEEQIVFCAKCGTVSKIPLAWKTFTCDKCQHRTNIMKGPVSRGAFVCPGCETRTAMQELFDEEKPFLQKLFAVEVLIDGTKERIFKKADESDLKLYRKAERQWLQESIKDRFIPYDSIPVINRDDRRPVSFGYKRYKDLFNSRQLLCLSALGKAIGSVEDSGARELLALAFSDCLASNNMFCFYAFDYGKLTPLFGLHAYVKMTRPVENNVWGANFGRGSFLKCFNKMLEGKRYANKPYEYKYDEKGPKQEFTGESISCELITQFPDKSNKNPFALLLNQSSENFSSIPSASVDLILSDPPYYNNLAYSELSDFYHVWLKKFNLNSYPGNNHRQTPLKESLYVSQRERKSEESHERFAQGLASAFSECYRVLKENGIFVFTFHHNEPKAWAALAKALLKSGFCITNVFPVRSEGQSRFHSDNRNIKWDEVFVCRKRDRAQKSHNHNNLGDKLLLSIERDAKRQLGHWTRILRKEKFDFNSCDARSLMSGLMIMYLSKKATRGIDFEALFAKSYSKSKLKSKTSSKRSERNEQAREIS